LVAGGALLACLPVAYVHNRYLHTRLLSFAGWMASAALLSVYLSSGGSGRDWRHVWPRWELTVAAMGLGLFLHFATSIRDLKGDHVSGSRSLPLRIAVRTNATTLFWITVVLGALATTGLVLALAGPGLHWR
jgi:4-hydroxybenzoate polyprenyltransferase